MNLTKRERKLMIDEILEAREEDRLSPDRESYECLSDTCIALEYREWVDEEYEVL